MKNRITGLFIVMSLVLVSCDDGPQGDTAGVLPVDFKTHIVPEASSGFIYYQSNCGVCHSAGTKDTSSAFGASDLASPAQRLKITAIEIRFTDLNGREYYNLSAFDGSYNMMKRFSKISVDRIHQLDLFLNSAE